VSTSDESTLEFTMLVDEAVVAVIAVVLAYGIESALPAGAAKLMVTAPVAPETLIPVPATLEVTPVLVMVRPEPITL
jgi:hypothetical protein